MAKDEKILWKTIWDRFPSLKSCEKFVSSPLGLKANDLFDCLSTLFNARDHGRIFKMMFGNSDDTFMLSISFCFCTCVSSASTMSIYTIFPAVKSII